MRIKLTISYDGTNFCGWQVQPNKRSVQGVLIEAILSLTGQTVALTGSGRTDAGVHAKGQVAHFDIDDCTIPPEKFFLALNTLLPSDVRVLQSEQVLDTFDACRTAKKKTYAYTLYACKTEQPLKERYSVRTDLGLDLQLIKDACEFFIGEHDFKLFCASGSSVKTTVRTIYDLSVNVSDGDYIFTVTGNGFLYNMVRIIVGVLMGVGYGKITLLDVKKMIDGVAKPNGIKTMPAKALCLQNVEY